MRIKRDRFGRFRKGCKPFNYIDGRSKNNRCIDCDKKISFSAIRCINCAIKHMFDIGLRKRKFIKKCEVCGKQLRNFYAKRCNKHKSLHGKLNPAYKDGRTLKSNYYKKYVREKSRQYRYSENKQCQCGRPIANKSESCKLCELDNKGHVKRIRYRGKLLRGNWEFAYAKHLDKQGIEWLYEPRTFKFKKYSYTPDFYLPKSDIYVEIKGYWRNNSKQKYLNFRKTFGNIILLNGQRLKKLGIIK
jgi:hypothetical protein